MVHDSVWSTAAERGDAERAAAVLAFVRVQQRRGHPFPSARVIAARLGWAETTTRAVMASLAADGAIRRVRRGCWALC